MILSLNSLNYQLSMISNLMILFQFHQGIRRKEFKYYNFSSKLNKTIFV